MMVNVSGVGCGLSGDLPVLPAIGEPNSTDYAAYALPFSHEKAKASPGSYEVSRHAPAGPVKAELSATTRTGWQRYTFPEATQATVLINTGQALQAVTSSDAKIIGDRTIETTMMGQGFCQSTRPYTLHFVLADRSAPRSTAA